MKKIILSIVAGFVTLSFGLAVFYSGQILVSMFQTAEQNTIETVKVEEIEPQVIPVEELVYPKFAGTATAEGNAPAKAQETETNTSKERSETFVFEPTGEYYLIGGSNKTFQDLDGLYIKTANYKDDPNTGSWIPEAITPEGYIYNEDGKEMKFVRLFISNTHLAFETVSKNGISYRFEGKFIEGKEVKYDGETDYCSYRRMVNKSRKRQGHHPTNRPFRLCAWLLNAADA